MAPGGFFCMSGPVAHADDDDDDDNDLYVNSYNTEIQSSIQFCTSPLQAKPFTEAHRDLDIVKLEKGPHVIDSSDAKCTPQQEQPTSCPIRVINSNGTGKIYWPSGSHYAGEVSDGNLHGIGTYTGADGTSYQGNWILNRKHGFGRKRYTNGDAYEGLWKWDVPDGKGRYQWSNGSEYFGDWQNGLMCGHGILKWENGDSYEGNWINGLADGHGVYTWADGSAYIGTWNKGSKCSTGRFYSPGRHTSKDCPQPESKVHPIFYEAQYSDMMFPRHSDVVNDKEVGLPGVLDSCSLRSNALKKLSPGRLSAASVFNGDFDGRLSDFNSEFLFSISSENDCECCLTDAMHQKICADMSGSGNNTCDLILALQIGIRHSVMEATKSQNRKPFLTDFGPKAVTKHYFSGLDSCLFHQHLVSEFVWTDYCTTVFRNLREIFGISSSEYLVSMTGSAGFKNFHSSGKSGCFFYLSQDGKYLIKTLRKSELKVFVKMLPKYHNHVRMHRDTLLTKFLGLHSVKLSTGKKVHFIVMSNITSSELSIHEVFDLKGSSEGRTASKPASNQCITPLKDLDLDFVFDVDPLLRMRVLEQIQQDCSFLESQHIMDYSLLIGVHFKDQLLETGQVQCTRVSYEANAIPILSDPKLSSVENDVPAKLSSVKDGRDYLQIDQCSSRISAKAYRCNWQSEVLTPFSMGQDVVLHIGIIDVLQHYGLTKKLEHTLKSVHFDPRSISAVDPNLYSRRFQNMMHKIFVAESCRLHEIAESSTSSE